MKWYKSDEFFMDNGCYIPADRVHYSGGLFSRTWLEVCGTILPIFVATDTYYQCCEAYDFDGLYKAITAAKGIKPKSRERIFIYGGYVAPLTRCCVPTSFKHHKTHAFKYITTTQNCFCNSEGVRIYLETCYDKKNTFERVSITAYDGLTHRSASVRFSDHDDPNDEWTTDSNSFEPSHSSWDMLDFFTEYLRTDNVPLNSRWDAKGYSYVLIGGEK